MNPFIRKIGCFESGNNQLDFVVWAPEQKKVDLKILVPGAIQLPMSKDEWGYWKITVPVLAEGRKYVYMLEDGSEYADPASLAQPDGVHGPSAIVDRSFHWTDDAWKGLKMEDLIIYELHTGTFTREGTFEAIKTRLNYLKCLGVNAIEIMPIAQFSGSRNWGYDGVFLFAPQNTYGTAHDLKALVDAAHEHGIAVILDVVYNHTGPEGSVLKNFSPHYFTDKYKNNWADAFNFDGPYSDGVRNYFIQNTLMWLEEFHIDGLRMDAVHAIYDHGAHHFLRELKEAVNALEERTGRKKILIAEMDLNDTRFLDAPSKGGYGLDGQWIDEFHHALHSVLTGETNGYYEDFGTLEHLEKAYRNTYVYNGIYSRHRKKIFGSQPEEAYDRYVVFSQNHDHIGNRPLGDRLTKTLSFEALKLAAASVLISPYVPLLFMGEEYAEKNPFFFFVDHEDKNLGKKVSEGRKKEFGYFNFKEEFPDPLSEEVFKDSRLSWRYDEPESAVMLSFYKKLIHFRKSHPVMQAREREDMTVYPATGNVLVIERFDDSSRLLFVMNFGRQPDRYLNNTTSTYRKLIDSSDKEWNGPQSIFFGELAVNESIEILPLSITIFESI